MRIGAIFIALFLFYGSIALAQNLETKMDSISYSVGYLMGKNLKQQGFKGLNYEDFKNGIAHALDNQKAALSDAEIEMNFQKAMMDIQSNQASAYEQNKLDGVNFLAENKKRPEVVSLPSGLQYEVMVEGDGAYPKATDKVKTHYHGTLIDGTVFDSSVERGEPISFPVNGVIQGWQEALQLMKVGSKWKLFVPYNLAYGDRAAGPTIKPFSTLIFEVELLDIE
jgi:FKBP-type peptidyl-prolyl cis-trans isomerase FklB